jgi:hypothetical protein
MMVSRILPILAILAVSACGDDDDTATANVGGSNPGGTASTGGRANAGGSAGRASTGGTAGTTNGGGAGGVAGGASTACVNCVAGGTCLSSATACYISPDCAAILACAQAQACQDQTCVAACIGQNPAGEALFTPAFTCIQTNCSAQCLGG